MPNTTNLPLDQLEQLLIDTLNEVEMEIGKAGKKALVQMPFQEENLNKAVLRTKLKRLALRGTTKADAARLLGVCPSTVATIYCEPEFKRDVLKSIEEAFGEHDALMQASSITLEEQIEAQALDSFTSLVGMLKGHEGPLTANQKIKIHLEFLNRAEQTVSKRVNISQPSLKGADAETLARAAQAGREMDAIREQKMRRIK